MKDKTVLIVGGTGSWGRELIVELLGRGVREIRVYARNEHQMVKIIQVFDTPRLIPVIGDIRDKNALSKACTDCDILFHLAALKHVPICEKAPHEAFLTNVCGTQNIIDVAVDKGVPKVVYVSTDKAVDANCAYGCSKRIGEKLILAANEQHLGNTRFIVFRSGNLLGSAGSVVPIFEKQIAGSRIITLTDDRMTRFFITIQDASRLLCEVAIRGAGGEIFLPTMPSLRIGDIAHYFLEKNNLSVECIETIGIRPGEKLHERMLCEEEREHLFRLSDELFLVAGRDTHGWAANGMIIKSLDYTYQSEDSILSSDETAAFLRAAGI